MSCRCSVHLTHENYIWYGNVGKLPRLVLPEDKTFCATVDPSELHGPPGSSLLWSVTWIKVLK